MHMGMWKKMCLLQFYFDLDYNIQYLKFIKIERDFLLLKINLISLIVLFFWKYLYIIHDFIVMQIGSVIASSH